MTKWDIINETYLKKGLKIIPLDENKVPILPNWLQECSSEYMQVLYWYTKYPAMNIGLPCEPNELFVLDIDCKDGQVGLESWKQLLKDLNISEPQTLVQETWSGGLHYIFKTDSDLKKVLSRANFFKDYTNIDIRNKSQIVVYPSVVKGKEYKYINDNEIMEMPIELKEFIIKNNKIEKEKNKKGFEKPKEIIEKGSRDDTLFAYINDLYFKTNLDYEEILLLVYNFNEQYLDPEFTEKTLEYKVKKAFEKDRGRRIIIILGEE